MKSNIVRRIICEATYNVRIIVTLHMFFYFFYERESLEIGRTKREDRKHIVFYRPF